MKNTFYFDHDYSAMNDVKILKLRANYGMAGYGVYWGIIETLCRQDGYIYREDIEGMAFGMQYLAKDLEDLINYCITIGLLNENRGAIYSERILEHYEIRNKKREAGRAGGLQRLENLGVAYSPKEVSDENDQSAQAVLKQCLSNPQAVLKQCLSNPQAVLKLQEERRGEDIKGKEREREETSPGEPDAATPTLPVNPKKQRKNSDLTKCLFKNSKFFDPELLRATVPPDYQHFDFKFYYNRVADWSAANNGMKSDWPATLRNFMTSDEQAKKAVYLKSDAGKPKVIHEMNRNLH